jgi:DNA-binding transcriptional MerR regulator
MQISEVAERTGVPARLLRYYEQQGLVRPARDARGWRVYSDADLATIERVRDLLDSAIPTALVSRLLEGRNDGPGRGAPDAAVLEEITAARDRIAARIDCLARNRDALTEWLRAARAR